MGANILQVSACRLTHAGEFAPEIRATLEGYSVRIILSAWYVMQQSEGFDIRSVWLSSTAIIFYFLLSHTWASWGSMRRLHHLRNLASELGESYVSKKQTHVLYTVRNNSQTPYYARSSPQRILGPRWRGRAETCDF